MKNYPSIKHSSNFIDIHYCFTEHEGIISPTALIIKNHMKENNTIGYKKFIFKKEDKYFFIKKNNIINYNLYQSIIKKNYPSIKSPFDFASECKGILPTEIINKIFKEHEGLISPTALLIKNHMKENLMMEYTQLEYYIKYENVSVYDIEESVFDWEFIFMNLNNIRGLNDKYWDLWEYEIYRINPLL